MPQTRSRPLLSVTLPVYYSLVLLSDAKRSDPLAASLNKPPIGRPGRNSTEKFHVRIDMLVEDREISLLQKERGGCTDKILLTSTISGLRPCNQVRNTEMKQYLKFF
jgi:hypothetical protein